jgi:4-aminobutyrate aminotransferase-like enzyme
LNTNSRYLSITHAEYTEALLATFPPYLNKCFLCNSGSEANDLALQIAVAMRPEAHGVAVMEGAYHGHITSMMLISPYKFWGPQGGSKGEHVHVLPLPDSYRCDATIDIVPAPLPPAFFVCVADFRVSSFLVVGTTWSVQVVVGLICEICN